MSRVLFGNLIAYLFAFTADPVLGMVPVAKQSCDSDHSRTVYMAASCVNGVCEGHKSYHYLEKGHALACSRQVKFRVESLNRADKAIAVAILRSMKRKEGTFVAELQPKSTKACSVRGSEFCLGDNIVKIRSASASPGSGILVDNLASALKRKRHLNEGLILGEVFYLLQVVFSSFTILTLGAFLISHERRRLIAGILTLAYMSVFVYFYGMEAFFVRSEALPLANLGMLVIMAFSAVSAVRIMLKDLQNGLKMALHGAIVAAEMALCLYLLYNPMLDLVTIAYGVFYVGIPVLLGVFLLASAVVSLSSSSDSETLDEGPSYSFG